MTELSHHVQSLGAVDLGDWRMRCSLHTHVKPDGPGHAREMFEVKFGGRAHQTVLLAYNSKKQMYHCADTHDSAVQVVDKMKQFTSKQSALIKGKRFKFRDFLICIGTVETRATTKGVIMELEYLPCTNYGVAHGILKEMCVIVAGKPLPPSSLSFAKLTLGSTDTYTAKHLSYQYIMLLQEHDVMKRVS